MSALSAFPGLLGLGGLPDGMLCDPGGGGAIRPQGIGAPKALQTPNRLTVTGLDPSGYTAGINRSNTAVRVVLEQPCLTGGWTGTVRPKQEPTGWTDLSNRSRLVLCDRSQELIGQACPTLRQVLWSDSACPTTGRTRLLEHRLNCCVQLVNSGSDINRLG
ncbi:hypothetical protein PCASD_24681 [Puccinia coronata f. sp. avenae]|uniref:Uncharacterized protein n=1 Tax=Puccinia coronata f. sp. avenae TaxID=200324 RepID=A0A2N5RVU5_9BASI|nr:hypothetical protein PCASD_24681 [Puccinia coronata f. sp. avenae]